MCPPHTHTHMHTHTHTHTHTDPYSTTGLQRGLYLALQWVNFPEDTNDLLLLFSLDLFPKLVMLSGLVSTKIVEDVAFPLSELTKRMYMTGLLTLEMVSLRTG